MIDDLNETVKWSVIYCRPNPWFNEMLKWFVMYSRPNFSFNEIVKLSVMFCRPNPAALDIAKDFTVFIKNYIEFPKFGVKRYVHFIFYCPFFF